MIQARIDSSLREMEVDPEVVGVGRTIDDVLEMFTDSTEAVYVGALLQLSEADFDRLIAALQERKIPSFSLMGRSEVERGLLATANPGIISRIVRRVALNVQRILLGDEPVQRALDGLEVAIETTVVADQVCMLLRFDLLVRVARKERLLTRMHE